MTSAAFGDWTVTGTRTINARSGFSVAIPCTPPSANPAPRVVWQADGVDIPAADPLNGGDAERERIQVLPSGHLVIHELGASDFAVAQYRCSVRNVRTHSTSDSPQTVTLVEGTNCLNCVQLYLYVYPAVQQYGSTVHSQCTGVRCAIVLIVGINLDTVTCRLSGKKA